MPKGPPDGRSSAGVSFEDILRPLRNCFIDDAILYFVLVGIPSPDQYPARMIMSRNVQNRILYARGNWNVRRIVMSREIKHTAT